MSGTVVLPSHGGQRHWFTIEPGLRPQQVRQLFNLIPVGASLDTYDPTYDSPSEVGAWATFRRYPEIWTAEFRNHGWSSSPVPVDLEEAALVYWETYDIAPAIHMPGWTPKTDVPREPIEHMAESGLDNDLPSKLNRDPNDKGARFLQERIAAIRKRLQATMAESNAHRTETAGEPVAPGAEGRADSEVNAVRRDPVKDR